jgi:hypothetical protein
VYLSGTVKRDSMLVKVCGIRVSWRAGPVLAVAVAKDSDSFPVPYMMELLKIY